MGIHRFQQRIPCLQIPCKYLIHVTEQWLLRNISNTYSSFGIIKASDFGLVPLHSRGFQLSMTGISFKLKQGIYFCVCFSIIFKNLGNLSIKQWIIWPVISWYQCFLFFYLPEFLIQVTFMPIIKLSPILYFCVNTACKTLQHLSYPCGQYIKQYVMGLVNVSF